MFYTSVGVEPTNAACEPSTATSDVLNHYTIEASPKKDAQKAYIMAPDCFIFRKFSKELSPSICLNRCFSSIREFFVCLDAYKI